MYNSFCDLSTIITLAYGSLLNLLLNYCSLYFYILHYYAACSLSSHMIKLFSLVLLDAHKFLKNHGSRRAWAVLSAACFICWSRIPPAGGAGFSLGALTPRSTEPEEIRRKPRSVSREHDPAPLRLLESAAPTALRAHLQFMGFSLHNWNMSVFERNPSCSFG